MQCPSCKKNQPMSFRCRSCGADLARRSGSARVSSAGGAAAVAVPMDGGFDAAVASAGPKIYSSGALASRGSRLAASIIDVLIALASMAPGFLFMSGGAATAEEMLQEGALAAMVGPVLLGLYYMFILARDGQTLGKKIMKIRIVRFDDGTNPGFGRVVGLRVLLNGLLGNIPFYALVDVLFIFGAQQRCVHDYIAGTKVIQA